MLHKFSGLKAVLLAVLVVALGIGLAGCSSKSSSSNGKIKITATTDFYGEVAKKVAGNKGDVTSIITNPTLIHMIINHQPRLQKKPLVQKS